MALLCINICRFIDPSKIIIGGGMAQAGASLLSRIHHHIQARSWTILPNHVELVLASSPNHSGIIGAAFAARHNNNKIIIDKNNILSTNNNDSSLPKNNVNDVSVHIFFYA